MDPTCRILSDVDGPVLLFSLTYASAVLLYVELAVMSSVLLGLHFDFEAVVFTMCPPQLNRMVVLQPFPRRIVAVGSPTRSVSAKSRRICMT